MFTGTLYSTEYDIGFPSFHSSSYLVRTSQKGENMSALLGRATYPLSYYKTSCSVDFRCHPAMRRPLLTLCKGRYVCDMCCRMLHCDYAFHQNVRMDVVVPQRVWRSIRWRSFWTPTDYGIWASEVCISTRFRIKAVIFLCLFKEYGNSAWRKNTTPSALISVLSWQLDYWSRYLSLGHASYECRPSRCSMSSGAANVKILFKISPGFVFAAFLMHLSTSSPTLCKKTKWDLDICGESLHIIWGIYC